MSIKRDMCVTRKGLDACIDVTYGTDLIPIELRVVDFTVPQNAVVVAYAASQDSKPRKIICDISDNIISFEPTPGFFEVGVNIMQIRVTASEKELFSYSFRVMCHDNIASDDAEEVEDNPSLVEQLMSELNETKKEIADEKSQRQSEIDVERKRIDNIIVDKTSGLKEYKITELYLNNAQYNNDGSNYFIKASNPVFAGNSENIEWGTTSKDVRVLNVGVHFSDTKYTADSHYEKVGEDSDYVYSGDTGAIVEYKEVESDEYDHAWYYTCLAGYYADPPGLYANFRVLIAYSVDEDNTELEDIRVGADGVTYDSAGDAVRTQITSLKGDLDELDTRFETGKNLFNPNTLKEFKSIDSNGNIVDANTEGNMFDISDFITIKKGETAYFSYNNDPFSVLYAFSTDTSNTGWIRATANNYTASADGYIILRFNHASPNVEKMQVEIGTGVTFFEPFHYEIERYENKFGGIGGLSLANKYPLSDANEAENNRVYSIAYTGCNNLPVNGMQGTLITFQCGSNSGRTQIFIRAVKNTMYVRHYWSDWSAWSEIVNTSALNTVKSAIESKIPSIAYASVGMFEKIAIIGDSYASGEIYKQTDTGYNYTSSNGTHYYVKDYYNLSWLQVMARKNGVKGVNLSVGGLSTRTWLTDKNGLQKMLTEEAQNLYIMGLGINDVGKLGTSYIGSVSDIHDEDYTLNEDTFYGNYGKIIAQVKNHAPNCKIIMMAMANNTNAAYAAFNTAIVNIANHYNIPVIKQYDDEFFLSDFYKNHMINGHPTADVYSGMAISIDRLICDAIKSNYSYFVDYVG